MSEFACHYSPVLKAAFNSSFLEGQTQTYRLEDISPSAFRLLVQWLYGQNIDLHIEVNIVPDDAVQSIAVAGKNDSDEAGDGQRANREGGDDDGQCANRGGDGDDGISPDLYNAWRTQDLDLAQLWVAGDRLLMPRLQNAVIMAWHELWTNDADDRGPSTSWIHYAYEHTCVGSPLRNLAVDQVAFSLEPYEIKKYPDDLPREMLFDLTLIYSKAVNPIVSGDDDFEVIFGEEDWEKRGMMTKMKLRYSCTRTWRSYLVPEDAE